MKPCNLCGAGISLSNVIGLCPACAIRGVNGYILKPMEDPSCKGTCYRIVAPNHGTAGEIHHTYPDEPMQGYIVAGGYVPQHRPFDTLAEAVNALVTRC